MPRGGLNFGGYLQQKVNFKISFIALLTYGNLKSHPLMASPKSTIHLTLSLSKVNLTKPRKLLNPELSLETYQYDHSDESS